MRRIWSTTFFIFVLLIAPSLAFSAGLPRDSIAGDSDQWMDVTTNAASPLHVEIRKSYRPRDTYCAETVADGNIDVASAEGRRPLFAFARQQEPGIALYEWHVCFVIDGTTYRAWHGYDPGPGATLHAHCFIDADQILAKDLTKNICPTADVVPNLANYAEYGLIGSTQWTPEPCTDVSTIDGSGPRGEECFRHRGAFDHETGANPRQRDPRAPHLSITTNSQTPILVQYRLSRTPNDYDCKLAQGTHWTISNTFTVGAAEPKRLNIGLFGFSRQFLPAEATYEWHICFVVDNTLYRAWRGYDPGPGGGLSVDCFIDTAVLETKDTTHYLCSKAEASLNSANYNEYGIYCEPMNANACRRFGTKEEYDSWLGLQNPLSSEEQDQIAEAVVKYAYTHPTYLSANSGFELYLSVRGRDPTPDFLECVSAGASVQLMPGSKIRMERVGTVLNTNGGMLVSVGAFTVTQPNTATGGISGFCGVLCAGGSAVTVVKRNGEWEVQGFTLTSVQ